MLLPAIQVDFASKVPLYKQLMRQFENAIHGGSLSAGEQIPSMNDLSAATGISKETVKKTYGLLRDEGLIVPRQGKGFYVADLSAAARPLVLVLFDRFSVYKQTLFNSFVETLGGRAEISILMHNQRLDLFERCLDLSLDQFDYYLVSPHFPLDAESQRKAVKLISRIPYPKLILLERLQPAFEGNFGAVYQDYENDIYKGLSQGLDRFGETSALKVISVPTCLYAGLIRKGVIRFCREHGIPVEFLAGPPAAVSKGDTYLFLSCQLDVGLVDLVRRIRSQGLEVGTDVRIISLNEWDMNELILGGLTTVSTDYRQMGRLAAEMILERHLSKIHCDFRMTPRSTF